MEINKSKVLVLGRGFLGKQFEKNGFTVWGRDKFDWSGCYFDEDEMFEPYDFVINTIGCADTRYCERQDSWREISNTNSTLPLWLSSCSKDVKFKLVHISSGCVYDQNNEPQTEESNLTSHCKYVVSKIVGEYGCNPEKDLILRPRLFFGETEDKNNLLTKINRFDKFLTEMNSFTSVQTIVEATEALLKADASGVFNVAQTGYMNMHQIAQRVGIENPQRMSNAELHAQENLHLVNNILDLNKLQQYYQPRSIEEEIDRCWNLLHN